MANKNGSLLQKIKPISKPRNVNYISAKESARISRENRRITDAIEKQRNRKNVPESEYLTTMKNPENVVEFDNLHTYFFTDVGTVKASTGLPSKFHKVKLSAWWANPAAVSP